MFHNKAEEAVEYLRGKSQDIYEKRIPFWGGNLWLFYIRQIIDVHALTEYILKPVIQQTSEKKALKVQQTFENIIITDDSVLDDDFSKIEQYILDGYCVLLFSGDKQYIAVNINKAAHRQVSAPEMHYSYRGPRDAFVEDININLSLIRKRLKDKHLTVEKMHVGKRSRTGVVMLHIKDIANPASVNEVKKKDKQH